jgi:uncharacterized RDD family membrane protein YckC
MELTIKRIIAYCIDGLIVGIPSLVLSLVFGFIRLIFSLLPFMGFLRHPFWAFSVTSVVVYILYESIGLIAFKTTVGKYFMNLRVRSIDSDVSNFRFILRTIFKALFSQSFLFILTILSLVIMVVKDKHSSLHDMLARTEVYEMD